MGLLVKVVQVLDGPPGSERLGIADLEPVAPHNERKRLRDAGLQLDGVGSRLGSRPIPFTRK